MTIIGKQLLFVLTESINISADSISATKAATAQKLTSAIAFTAIGCQPSFLYILTNHYAYPRTSIAAMAFLFTTKLAKLRARKKKIPVE